MYTKNLAILGYESYHQMLSDNVRMDAFRKAIFETVKPGDIVIDFGAGTGILGLWALQAGAEKVYAIEKTDSIELAKSIAKANGLFDKIIFLQENSLDVKIPEKVDLIMSETLGSFAIDENTIEFTNDLRKRFLKEEGTLIPRSVQLFATPFECKEVYDKIDFWRHIPNLNFDPAFDIFSSKILVESLEINHLLANPAFLGMIDFTQDNPNVFKSSQVFSIGRGGVIHGVSGWFRCHLTDSIDILTSPDSPSTHWKQAIFPFKRPINVVEGDLLQWEVSVESMESGSDNCKVSYDYRCSQIDQ